MHLHGRTFVVAGKSGRGIGKHNINVPLAQMLLVDRQADHPDRWAMHCRDVYHAELAMMKVASYVA